MSNDQTTDPIVESNREPNPSEWPNAKAGEDVLPATVRDPGATTKVPAGTPTWRGSQASDF